MKSHKQIQAACIMAASSLLFQMVTFLPCEAAKHFVTRKNTVATVPVQGNLMRLRKAESLWSVLDDTEVQKCLKETMGAAVEKYYDATQITELPNAKGNELYSAGGVRGLYTVSESFFDLDLSTKKLCIIVLNQSNLEIYGVESFEQLPEAARAYIEDLQSRIAGLFELNPSLLAVYGVDSVDKLSQADREQIKDLQSRISSGNQKLNIQFKKPDTNAPALAKKPEPKKNLKLGVVTGSYSRVDSNPRFENADFKVVRLPGNQIKFCCTAFNGSHSGEASAVVPIVNNSAEYSCEFDKDYGYKLSMQFDGKYVYVNQEGDGFGGIGVTASGTYQKMDDRAPQIEAGK